MKKMQIGIIALGLALLNACGPDTEESIMTQEPEQTSQGILSNSQQQALEAAASVEQQLLDSAADRQKELEARLRTQ